MPENKNELRILLRLIFRVQVQFLERGRRWADQTHFFDIFHISSIEEKAINLPSHTFGRRWGRKATNDLAWPDVPVENYFKSKNIRWELVYRKNILRIF